MKLQRNEIQRRCFSHRRGPSATTRSTLFRSSIESLEAPFAGARDGCISCQGQLYAHENRRQMRLSPKIDFFL